MLFSKKKIKQIILQNKELEWANIYHDSIRGKDYLESLPLNIGRWAGNYSFFYVLNRILMDYKPNSILELGLGESTKFISAYIKNYLLESTHVVVEHDSQWISVFKEKNSLSERSSIVHCELGERTVKSFKSTSYTGFKEKVNQKFDLYIVDGPFGSAKFSRYDIVDLVEGFSKDEEFIILFDDYERDGEIDTTKEIIQKLKDKNISFHTQKYSGIKSQLIIATDKYKYSISF
jgi:hypothetical protein